MRLLAALLLLAALALARVFGAYDEIEAVYVFGSVVAGTARPGSDLDLGVWTRHDASLHHRKLDVLTDLTHRGIDHVDLAFLNRADPVVQYEAVRLNCIAYQTETFDRGYVYSKVLRTYLDFLPYLRRQRAAYKKRVLDTSCDVIRPDVIRKRLDKLDVDRDLVYEVLQNDLGDVRRLRDVFVRFL